jgi:hypothetical protein
MKNFIEKNARSPVFPLYLDIVGGMDKKIINFSISLFCNTPVW